MNIKENIKTLLVTGAAGFLGRYVVQHFTDQGWTVIGIDSASPENASISNLLAYYSLKLPDAAIGDVLRKYSPDACIHCAGRASVPLSVADPSADYYANTVLTFEILNALRLHAPKCKLIYMSSAAVYGDPQSLPVRENASPDPISPYGFHKLQGELLCSEYARIYGLQTASVRVFSAYGPGLRRQVLWDICRKVITNKILVLQGTGKESRDFIHARDIARGLRIVVENAQLKGEIYNLASGSETTIEELAQMVLEALNVQCKLEFDGVVPTGVPHNWCADISKLNSLGFEISIPLGIGVGAFSKWCNAELENLGK